MSIKKLLETVKNTDRETQEKLVLIILKEYLSQLDPERARALLERYTYGGPSSR